MVLDKAAEFPCSPGAVKGSDFLEFVEPDRGTCIVGGGLLVDEIENVFE
jgi:hypothetical protein